MWCNCLVWIHKVSYLSLELVKEYNTEVLFILEM